VVVPTYDEKENIGPLVDALEGLAIPTLCVLFVDDSSPDGTADEIRKEGETRKWVNLLLRTGKRGFSSACQDGLREAIARLDPSVLISMDADMQHTPSTIPSLIEAIVLGADVAVASRYVKGGGVEGWSFSRRIVSSMANSYARVLLGLSVKDCTSGFKAFSRKAALKITEAKLRTKRFEYQIETLSLLRGFKIVEVPYTFVTRKAGQSKLRFWDLPRFFFAIAAMRLS
jgi:dolichol-phosphate mannosyltransferase